MFKRRTIKKIFLFLITVAIGTIAAVWAYYNFFMTIDTDDINAYYDLLSRNGKPSEYLVLNLGMQEDDDIVFIQSPVGMPAKAIKTKFLDEILRGERKEFICDYRCLRTCDPATVQYCIAKALMNAADGDIDNAVVFAGTNVSRIKKIVHVKELIDEIVSEAAEEMSNF